MAAKTDKFFMDIYEFHFFMYNLTCYTYVDFKVAWLKLLHAIVYHILCTILIFHCILSVYLVCHTLSDTKEVMFVLTMAGTTIGCAMKICVMEFYKKEVIKLHKELTRSLEISSLTGPKWADEARRKTEKKFQFITKGFYPIIFCAISFFVLLPVFFQNERALPYLFPVKNLPSPYYEIVYNLHGVIVIPFMVNTVSYDMICHGLLLRLSTNLKLISGGIRKLGELYPCLNYSDRISGYADYPVVEVEEDEHSEELFHNEDTEFCSYLKMCKNFEEHGGYDENLTKTTVDFLSVVVRMHQNVRRQVELVDKVFNFNLLVHVVAGSTVFCMSVASLFSEHVNALKDIRLTGFAIGGFLDLFIYCYCGSCFLESEEDLRIALYSLPWYLMDLKPRKLLIFMLTKLQRIKGLSAGRLCNVSVDLFLGVLKFSHSFIALLSEL